MAGMFKLTLLMILAAVCFLPLDDVDATITCYCPGGIRKPLDQACVDTRHKIDNSTRECDSGRCYWQEYQDRLFGVNGSNHGCGSPGGIVGCYPIPEDPGRTLGTVCICNTSFCNLNLQTAGFPEGMKLFVPSNSGFEKSGLKILAPVSCQCDGNCRETYNYAHGATDECFPPICYASIQAGQNQNETFRGCAPKGTMLVNSTECGELPGPPPTSYCACNTFRCNTQTLTPPGGSRNNQTTTTTPPALPSISGRLHGWASSVLNGISVTVLVVPFLGKS